MNINQELIEGVLLDLTNFEYFEDQTDLKLYYSVTLQRQFSENSLEKNLEVFLSLVDKVIVHYQKSLNFRNKDEVQETIKDIIEKLYICKEKLLFCNTLEMSMDLKDFSEEKIEEMFDSKYLYGNSSIENFNLSDEFFNRMTEFIVDKEIELDGLISSLSEQSNLKRENQYEYGKCGKVSAHTQGINGNHKKIA